MTIQHRNGKFDEVLRALAAKFFVEESTSLNSLITITSVDSSPDRSNVIIYFTVFPEDKQKAALDFAKRKRSEFKEYLKSEANLSRIPFIDFEIDLGERNRQKIDRLSIAADEGFENSSK
jgi:ribosome-binding factor A